MSMQTAEFVNHAGDRTIIETVPVTGRIGAEIRNVSLSRDLDPPTVRAIREALVRHKVVFFRDQDDLDDKGQEALAEALGRPVKHPTVPIVAGSRFLLELNAREAYGASSWHTDVTFLPGYPEASILRALVVPAAGGDTMWSNMATAYDDLSPALKQFAGQLRAVHSNVFDYAPSVPYPGGGDEAAFRSVFASTVYETEHPVVRVHPESGEKTMLLGHFLKQIVGSDIKESRQIYEVLQAHATRPENTIRWRWKVGDVAIWDNRATQHRAVADFGTQARKLRRATIAGEVPIGPDGRPSRDITVAA
jgi:alpha-ketoglutarate-dependent taurine dioxygenase